MHELLPILAALALAACAVPPAAVDPGSDAPEVAPVRHAVADLPATYEEAIARWRLPSEVNAWIGARFEYDFDRAMKLAENQRTLDARIQIHEPASFFAHPTGVCVDLARFAVETLRAVAPAVNASYLMIEFDPAVISGNTLRRHWVVQFEADGMLYFFADSKRPGHVAGPYRTAQAFLDQYSQYRQRRIVSYRTLESYERQFNQKRVKKVSLATDSALEHVAQHLVKPAFRRPAFGEALG
jgi:hypothetical protein